MINFEEFAVGRVIELAVGDKTLALYAYLKRIPAGQFRVVEIRESYVKLISKGTGKKEEDTVIEVVKISKAGKQIGKYRYGYTASFFMQNGTMKG